MAFEYSTRVATQKFPDWPHGALTVYNAATLC